MRNHLLIMNKYNFQKSPSKLNQLRRISCREKSHKIISEIIGPHFELEILLQKILLGLGLH